MIASVSFLLFAAAQAAPATTVTVEKPTRPEDKIVCKREESIGTRINTRKVCMKQSEWDGISRQAQEDFKASRNQRNMPGN